VRFVLGNLPYNAPNVREACEPERVLVTTKQGAYPQTDAGVDAPHLPQAAQRLDRELQREFQWHLRRASSRPTKGQAATARFALGAVLVYQIALLYQFEHGLTLNAGLIMKPFLRAA
jgi:hypothetical protein